MDAKAFPDSLLASLQPPAHVAAALSLRTEAELETMRVELLSVLHSASAPLVVRAAALTTLRHLGVDVLTEMKSLEPDVAADIATEAVLLQDEGGTLLDALEANEPAE
jgi:hypothetical protein